MIAKTFLHLNYLDMSVTAKRTIFLKNWHLKMWNKNRVDYLSLNWFLNSMRNFMVFLTPKNTFIYLLDFTDTQKSNSVSHLRLLGTRISKLYTCRNKPHPLHLNLRPWWCCIVTAVHFSFWVGKNEGPAGAVHILNYPRQ